MNPEPRPIDYLPEFVEAVKESLESGEKKWGNTWLNRPRRGQIGRAYQYIQDVFDRNRFAGEPIKWESIAGEALIGWIRDNHPELFPD